MRTLIYAHRFHEDFALKRVIELRRAGEQAEYRDTRAFDGQTEVCDRVLTDNPLVTKAYGAKGVEVLLFSDAPDITPPTDIPAPASAAKGGDPISGDEHEPNAGVRRPRRTRRKK